MNIPKPMALVLIGLALFGAGTALADLLSALDDQRMYFQQQRTQRWVTRRDRRLMNGSSKRRAGQHAVLTVEGAR